MTHAASAFAFPNLMIEHPWTSKDHERHRNRITEMKPSIDCTVPSSYYVMINRAKKDQQNEEWCARVDRDNELLLSRMAHVMTHHSILAEQQASSKQTWHHVSPNELNRKAEQRRIEVENKTILKRLKNKPSSYPSNAWKQHAKQFDKHSKEMKARRELIRNPHLIPTSPTTLKKQSSVRRLKPLKQEQNEWPRDADGNVVYDRQIEDIDVQQAAMKAEEEEKEAVVSSFNFSADFDSDVERAGVSDLIEHTIPEGAEVEQIYQAGHDIDGRQVIVSMDDCNAISSKRANQPGEHDEWGSFTAHPPSILHALLIRTYDLDSTIHSHLYLPFAPLRSLGKTRAERCARIVNLLGFNDDGELFFKQSLIKGQKKKVKRAQPKKEAFVQAHINKIEQKIAEEKEPAHASSDARDRDDDDEPDNEADAEADNVTNQDQDDVQQVDVQLALTQSQELDADCAPVNDDDMRPETAEFAVEAQSEEPQQYDGDEPNQSVEAAVQSQDSETVTDVAAGDAQTDVAADQEFETETQPDTQVALSDDAQVDDLVKGATQPFTTQVNESAEAEFESDPQTDSETAPAVAPAESEFESDPATVAQESEDPSTAGSETEQSSVDPSTETEEVTQTVEQPASLLSQSEIDPTADSHPVTPKQSETVEQPADRDSAVDENEFESDAVEPVVSSVKPETPRETEPENQQVSAKPSPRVPSLSRPVSSHAGVSPRLLAVETSRPSSKTGSKPTTPRLAPLPVMPTLVDAPPAFDRPLSKASPRLAPLSQAPVSPRVFDEVASKNVSRSTSPRPVAAVQTIDKTDDQEKSIDQSNNQSSEVSEADVQKQLSDKQVVAEEESYEDDIHTDDVVVPASEESEQSNDQPTLESNNQADVAVAVESATSVDPEHTAEPEYEDDHHVDEPQVAIAADNSADKEFPDEE